MVTEQTIEAEQDFDYSYTRNYDYGLLSQAQALEATTITETSTVQPATLAPQSTSLTATTITETSTVQEATLKEIKTLTATTITETSTVQAATLDPQSTSLTATTITETSTVQPATIGFGSWVLDGEPITPTTLTATPDTLEVTVPTRTDAVLTLLNTLDANAGELQRRERADGTIESLDTAAGANTYDIIPDIDSDPPRTGRTVRVEEIDREKSGPSGQTQTADIVLAPDKTRDPDAATDADDTSQWRFDFAPGGRVATNSVAANVQESQESTSLQLVLTPEQTQTLETTTGAVAGAQSEYVPDGESFDRDTTPNNRQTVTITSPDTASDPPIEQGDYLVLGWTTVGQGEGGYKVEIELTSL